MHDLTTTQRDLLWVIAGYDGDEPRGLRMKERLGEYRGKEINHGTLYPALNGLAEMGLVRKYVIDARSNGYELTDAGREELTERLDWEIEQAVEEVVINGEEVSHV